MSKGAYRRYGCKMGCGSFKCRHDTPPSGTKSGKDARKIMKHINKVRDRSAAAREVEVQL